MLIDTLLLVNLELLLCNNIIHENVFKNPFCWTGLHQTNPYLSMSQVGMRQPIYFRSSEVFPRAFPIFPSSCVTRGGCPVHCCYSRVLKRGGQPAAATGGTSCSLGLGLLPLKCFLNIKKRTNVNQRFGGTL